jgi:hypothetical protein
MTSTYFNAFLNGDLEPTSTHFWLLAGAIVGSLVVAAGIALEANWPISRMKPRELAGITFVFFGVGVEALFTLALFMFDDGLSSSQERTISAQQSRIVELDAKASAAESEAGSAIERAAKAGERAAEAEKESSATALKAEQLKAKNLELEAQIAPRRIDPQCKDFPPSVKSISGEVVRVDTYILDMDGGILGAQIAGCLHSLGINADAELSSVLPTGGFAVGVVVNGRNEPLVSAIKEALVKANIRFVDGPGLYYGNQRTSRAGSPSNPAATVMVGIKPPIDMK